MTEISTMTFDELRKSYNTGNKVLSNLAADIASIILVFSNKIDARSITGDISGVHIQDGVLHNPEGTYITFNCRYKFEESTVKGAVDIFIWYSKGKLKREGGLPPVIYKNVTV
jgi:hypothetical protein